jgi:sRNA-binding protein
MASQCTLDRRRGAAEAWQQIAVLREKWPAAFPADRRAIKPLQLSVAQRLAALMGWTVQYARGVLTPWKASLPYCHAVLCADLRITLEGEPAEPIDDVARQQATEQLARIRAKAAARIAKPAPSSAATAIAKPQPALTPAPEPKPLVVDSSGRLGLAGLKAAALARRQASAAPS